jgi:hypothetical protein
MLWKLPPRIKIFEALGSLADGRVEIFEYTPIVKAKISSSDGSKFYTVKYDEANNKISSDDNASKWQGYTGYPIIAVLMKLDKLPYDEELARGLKGIAWKVINTKYKNEWNKTEEEIFKELDKERYTDFAEKVLRELQRLGLQR